MLKKTEQFATHTCKEIKKKNKILIKMYRLLQNNIVVITFNNLKIEFQLIK